MVLGLVETGVIVLMAPKCVDQRVWDFGGLCPAPKGSSRLWWHPAVGCGVLWGPSWGGGLSIAARWDFFGWGGPLLHPER